MLPRTVSLVAPDFEACRASVSEGDPDGTLKLKVVSFLLNLPDRQCDLKQLAVLGNLESIQRIMHRHTDTFHF